jgi:ectoine hydroxylase-related dioxygenase (phytanoyl-CoA dioxygenase family)
MCDGGRMIPSAQREAFQRDGALLLPGLIDEPWLSRLREAIERDIERPGPCFHGYQVEGGRFHGNMRNWESDLDFRDYCLHSVLPEAAAGLLDVDEVRLYYDQLFVKEPGTNAPTRWHNDQPYWPVRGRPIMSFWLALDSVARENGALEFVRGSHRLGKWYQPEPFAPGGSRYERNPDYVDIPDIDAEREQHEFLGWEMEPGDVVAFHALTVHGAPANLSSARRRGYTVRYCGPGMTYYAGPGTSPFLSDDALADGAPLEGDRYPVVWRAAAESADRVLS